MAGDLNENNIIEDESTISKLFDAVDSDNDEDTTDEEKKPEVVSKGNKQASKEEVEELFEDSETLDDDEEDIKSGTPSKNSSSSSKNLYNTIARACADDGVFPEIDEEFIRNVNSAEDFGDLIENTIRARLNDRINLVTDALVAGGDSDKISRLNDLITSVEGVTPDYIRNNESEQADNIRRELIYRQALLHFNDEGRAKKELEKSIKAGTDIDDAIDAQKTLIKYYNGRLRDYVTNLQNKQAKEEELEARMTEDIAEYISDPNLLRGIEIDRNQSRRVSNTFTKVVAQNGDKKLNALEAFEKRYPAKATAIKLALYTLSDGFTDFSKLTKNTVTKQISKGFKGMADALKGSSSISDGTQRFIGNKQDSLLKALSKGEVDIDV